MTRMGMDEKEEQELTLGCSPSLMDDEGEPNENECLLATCQIDH